MSLFTDHPATVGETYFQHMGSASFFGSRMILAGLACMLHGMLPFIFTKTGSQTIELLYQHMVTRRRHPALSVAKDTELAGRIAA
jgi:hypothetical protein